MFVFKTLQRRLIVLLVVPLTLFLLGFGFFGYRFIQGILFNEWREIATLKLERAAHQMDMKLQEEMEWMDYFARAGQDSRAQEIQGWLLKQMKAQPGVRQVYLTWNKGSAIESSTDPQYHSATLSQVRFFYPSDVKIVGLRAELLDQAGRPVGRIVVLLNYDYLMQDILKEGWQGVSSAWA